MTVTVANASQTCQQRSTVVISKGKQSSRKKSLRNDDDDETINTSLGQTSKLSHTVNVPIAPMSPQLPTVRSAATLSSQPPTTSCETKKFANASSNSIRRPQRNSVANPNGIIVHPRHRTAQQDSSTANSSSTSPINLSRSTSPAASIANFIRPISPPYIQVKEPLSPKFIRASTSQQIPTRHRSPPPIVNNIDASTASAMTTLLIDDSSGYDSSENPNQRATTAAAPMSIISTVPESCFEPETYRNLTPLTTMNSQKKLSFSDPTLNQISRLTSQKTTTTENSNLSASSLPRPISTEERDIQTDDEAEDLNTSDDRSMSKEKSTSHRNRSRHSKNFSSPRHRMMTCTSGINDSLPRLSPTSDDDRSSNPRTTDHSNETSCFVMQNRPPFVFFCFVFRQKKQKLPFFF